MENTELKPRQRRFCELYVQCGNAEKAAREAGYSHNTCRNTACKMLTKQSIKNYINELNEIIANGNIASAQEIQEFLTAQLRGEQKEECVVVTGDETGSEASIIEKTITPKDRQKAADTLAKIKGMYKDTPDTPVTINIQPAYE